MNEQSVARGLGWFSIGLGVAELFAPRKMTRALGVRRHNGLVRTYGLREIGSGIGILAAGRRAPWIWSRVAGDALDLATLGAAWKRSRKRKIVGAAIASVAAVMAVDMLIGMRLRRGEITR